MKMNIYLHVRLEDMPAYMATSDDEARYRYLSVFKWDNLTDYALVGTVEIEVPVPGDSVRLVAVERIEESIRNISAKAGAEVTRLNAVKQNLLAIAGPSA